MVLASERHSLPDNIQDGGRSGGNSTHSALARTMASAF
jgi:hypothetical protein